MRPAAQRVPPSDLALAGVDLHGELTDPDQRVRHPNQRGYEPIALAGKRIMLAAKRLRIFRRLQFDATRANCFAAWVNRSRANSASFISRRATVTFKSSSSVTMRDYILP